jgi:hypothetical protein
MIVHIPHSGCCARTIRKIEVEKFPVWILPLSSFLSSPQSVAVYGLLGSFSDKWPCLSGLREVCKARDTGIAVVEHDVWKLSQCTRTHTSLRLLRTNNPEEDPKLRISRSEMLYKKNAVMIKYQPLE